MSDCLLNAPWRRYLSRAAGSTTLSLAMATSEWELLGSRAWFTACEVDTTINGSRSARRSGMLYQRAAPHDYEVRGFNCNRGRVE